MNMSIGKVYRGQGAAYIECLIDKVTKGHTPTFTVKSEMGIILPMAVYRMEDDRYVVATPLLETTQVIILVEIADEEGSVVFHA